MSACHASEQVVLQRLPWTRVLLAAAALAATGCLGYRVGTTLPAGISSVNVPVFENRTGEPQLEADATHALIAELQLSTPLQITTEEHADAVLEVALLNIREEPFRRGDRDVVEEYRLVIEAEASLVRRDSGEAVLDGERVQGRETFELVGTMSASRQAALPGASADLARNIRGLLQRW